MQLKRLKTDNLKKITGRKTASNTAVKSAAKTSAFVLFLGDEGAILVFIEGGKVVRRLFAQSAEKEHLASLLELLNTHASVPISVVIDMIDQSYVRHTLPPVSALGVNKLVQRRLDRDFAPEDIKGALPLGRETGGRKEWSFLLISLANSAVLQQWMNVVHELPNRLLGLYLVPVEAQDFIQAITDALPPVTSVAQWQILVSHNKVSGYRQVVLKDGKLIFTRLTQGSNESSPDVAAGNVEQEIQNTIEYLKRLSFNDQAGLDIFVIVSQDIKERLDIRRFNARRMNIFTPFEISQLLGLGQAALSGDRFGDVVISSCFALGSKRHLKLSTMYSKKLDQLYNIRLGARSLAAAIIIWMIYSIVSGLLAIQSAQSEASNLIAQEKNKREELESIKKKLDSIDKGQQDYSKAAILYQYTRVSSNAPLDVVRVIGSVMKEGVLARSMDWKLDDLPDTAQPAGSTATTGEQPILPYTAILDFEFTNHEGKKDILLDESQVFLSRVEKAFSGFEVTTLQMPGASKDSESVQMNFNDPQNSLTEIKEGENVMTVSIRGPGQSGATPGAMN